MSVYSDLIWLILIYVWGQTCILFRMLQAPYNTLTDTVIDPNRGYMDMKLLGSWHLEEELNTGSTHRFHNTNA